MHNFDDLNQSTTHLLLLNQGIIVHTFEITAIVDFNSFYAGPIDIQI